MLRKFWIDSTWKTERYTLYHWTPELEWRNLHLFQKTGKRSFLNRYLIGYIFYLAFCTQPDISHAVAVLPSFVSRPDACHWEVWKCVLTYVKGKKEMGFFYPKDVGTYNFHTHVDASFADDLLTRRWTKTILTNIGEHSFDFEFLTKGYHHAPHHRGGICIIRLRNTRNNLA